MTAARLAELVGWFEGHAMSIADHRRYLAYWDLSGRRRWRLYWLSWLGMLATIAAGLLWLATVPWPAWAQSGDRGDGHAEHHDWYRHLLTPQGYSCCNADRPDRPGDCRPVQARPRDDGSWEAFFGGRWQPVPSERILPDRLNRVPLHAHICEQDGYVRCFLKGGGGS